MGKFLTLFVFTFFIGFQISLAADNHDDVLLKVDKDYNKGDYKQALLKAKNLLAKSQESEDLLKIARVNFKLAKIYDALCRFEEYKQHVEEGAARLLKADRKDTVSYINACLEGSAAYMEYGEYYKASVLLENAKKFTHKIGSRWIRANLQEKEILNLFLMGYYNRAEQSSMDLVKVRKEILNDRSEKSTAKELRSKKSDLARAINLLAEIKLINSDFKVADSLISLNLKWISSNIGKKRIEYSRALFLKGLIYENRGEAAKAGAKFSKALKVSYKSRDIKHKIHSKPAIAYFEKLIPALRKAGHPRKASKREKQLEARIKRYYGKDNYAYAKTQLITADRLFKEKDYHKAQSKLQSLLKEKNFFPQDHIERATVLNTLYRAQIENEDYITAESTLQEISELNLKVYGKLAPRYHLGLVEEGKYIINYGSQLSKAERIFAVSLNGVLALEVPHNNVQYIEGLYSQAQLLQYVDKFPQALATLHQAKDKVEKFYGNTSDYYAVALNKLAAIQIALGQYNEAEENINKSLSFYNTKKNKEQNIDYAHSLETLSKFYIVQGKFREAERTVKKALKITKSANENEKVSTVAEELINLNILRGKYASTEGALLEIIKTREGKFGIKHRSLISPVSQLCNLYLITGDYNKAEKQARRAYAISEEIFGSNSVIHANSIKLLAKTFTAIGDYEKAEDAGSKALSIQSLHYGHNHLEIASTLNELAKVKFYNNPYDQESERLYTEAASIINSCLGSDNLHYAEILKNLSMFYIENRKNKPAEDSLNKANAIWIAKLGNANIHSAEAAYMKGIFFSKIEKYTDARESFEASKNLYGKIFDAHHPYYIKALSKEGQMAFILDDFKAAIRCLDETTVADLKFIRKYFPSLSDREKNKFWNLIKDDFEFYNTLAIKLAKENPELLQNVYDFSLKTKAILLNSSIKVKERILSSNNPELIKKYESWIDKREFLTSALSMDAAQQKENNIDVKLLEKEIEALEKDLSEKSEFFFTNYEKSDVNWKQVKAVLKPNEYAVEIIRFRYFDKKISDSVVYAGLVINENSKAPELVLIPYGNDLENKYLNYYRNCIKLNVEDQYSFEKFWKPFNNLIKQNATVFISGDGVYNQINIETICGPDKNYLLNKYEFVLVSNTRDLLSIHVKASKKDKLKPSVGNKIKLFGNPTYYEESIDANGDIKDSIYFRTSLSLTDGKRIPQLPGAEGEVKHLNDLMTKNGWETEIYLNNHATESNLKSIKDPKVFHIATHGFFMEDIEPDYNEGLSDKNLQNPLLRSGLLLKNGGALLAKNKVYELNSEDGILTAYEAMNLYLDHTELVVLSACETGVGKVQLGEGVCGLQRAFLIAGANSVIMSLFKVSDNVTKELMTIFYDKWLSTGAKRKSFLEAKRVIKEKYNDPIYWGAFIMVGLE
ncbi:hypothetical protein MYP_1323 [Sporocytophaga myxococcoides]|uniref:CHAT domain-containing protein n=1 Tax=Sporocytophaga myxococcoides TaxID=153721 RepID=A0A098LAZ2_9BACT|nr:CHAT domain-containing protein [Sporocytophaga myxococcoides]GAL84095.1 hypothetical protein MYP_1323 [Sporocytophaga myxococcoides]